MWGKRIVSIIAATVLCGSAAVSVGSGTASALPPMGEIFAAAESIAPTLARRWGMLEQNVKQLFIRQTTKLTPVADRVALKRVQAQWEGFTPRKARDGEIVVTPKQREVPVVFSKTKEVLCEAAIDFLAGDDVASWDYAWDQANGQITSLFPGGKRLALYSELGDIVEGFHNGCYCREFAALAVLAAKNRAC